jgi:hypothetical protein
MKVCCTIVLLILFWGVPTRAQQNLLEEGTVLFSAGIGGPNIAKNLYKFAEDKFFGIRRNFDFTAYSGILPITLKADYLITKRIGLGATFNYVNFQRNANLIPAILQNGQTGVGYVHAYYSSWSFIARINFHLITTEKSDFYVGYGLGYRAQKITQFSNLVGTPTVSSSSPLFPVAAESTIGWRYFFKPHYALYTELGIAKAIFQIGVVYKL